MIPAVLRAIPIIACQIVDLLLCESVMRGRRLGPRLLPPLLQLFPLLHGELGTLALTRDLGPSGRHDGPLDAAGLYEERQVEVGGGVLCRRGIGPRPERQGATSVFLIVKLVATVRRPSRNVPDQEFVGNKVLV